MYYQNYYPYNNNYQQQPQQNYFQTQQQGFNQQGNNLYVAQVNGLEGAKTYVVLPNQTFFLFDNENNTLFVKSVDNQGKCNIEIYKKNKYEDKNNNIDLVQMDARLRKLEEVFIYATQQQSNANSTNDSTSTK